MNQSPHVLTGLDLLVEHRELQEPFRGRRLALLINQASQTRTLVPICDALRGLGLEIVRLFAPEHGLYGQAQDMEAVDGTVDPLTGLKVVSLYGSTAETLRPRPRDLADVDVVLVDLPDIGARYYTFAATALYTILAAHEAGAETCVLDRPNPLGGILAEGNLIQPGFGSFVGAINVPNRHALTLVELLRLALRDGKEPVEMQWIGVSGWDRATWFDQTGLPWIMPSPNMPSLSTAAVYPGMCLLEATNLSEGRGTTRPFEIFGAPYVDARQILALLDTLGLTGVRFRPLLFKPVAGKWAGQVCQGAQLHLTDRGRFRPYQVGLAILWAAFRLFGDAFAWREKPYEFVADVPAIDLLCGTDQVRCSLESGDPFDDLLRKALESGEDYLQRIEPILIYE